MLNSPQRTPVPRGWDDQGGGAGGSPLCQSVCVHAWFGVALAAGLFGIPCAVTQARVTGLRGSGLPVAGVGLQKSPGDSHTPSPWKTAVTGLRSPWKPSVAIRQQWWRWKDRLTKQCVLPLGCGLKFKVFLRVTGQREALCSFTRHLGWVGHSKQGGVCACQQLREHPGESEHPPPASTLGREPAGELDTWRKAQHVYGRRCHRLCEFLSAGRREGFCATGLFIRQLPLAAIDACLHRNAPLPWQGRRIFMENPFSLERPFRTGPAAIFSNPPEI